MSFQIQHLPQDKKATPEQEWGFTLEEFIVANWIYLLAVLVLLLVFFYARYSWRKRHNQEKD